MFIKSTLIIVSIVTFKLYIVMVLFNGAKFLVSNSCISIWIVEITSISAKIWCAIFNVIAHQIIGSKHC